MTYNEAHALAAQRARERGRDQVIYALSFAGDMPVSGNYEVCDTVPPNDPGAIKVWTVRADHPAPAPGEEFRA